jgi:hypothetical protein
LDDTADVILAALTVADADENYQQDIAASLVKGFAGLQNPDHAKFPAFAGLARSHPQGFMDAACTLCIMFWSRKKGHKVKLPEHIFRSHSD